MQGYIKLHRKIQEHWIYQEKRKFSKYEAWIDMLMMANHKDNKFVLGNELVEVERGSFITSEKKLMDRWDWGKAKIRNFLEMLEKDDMIIKKTDRKKTTITIRHYCDYHDSETKSRPQADRKQTDDRPQADTNKNVKNANNEKNIPYADIVGRLNEKAGKKFKHTSRKTQEYIRARWNEGNSLDDFYAVIDFCSNKWSGQTFSNGQKGDHYLQPSTLFNGKFDERLNWTLEQTQEKQHRPNNSEMDEHMEMLRREGLLDE